MGTGGDNGGAFSVKLFCWIFAVRHATIKSFVMTLVVSLGEHCGCPGCGIGGFRGQAILAVGYATIKSFPVTLVVSRGKRCCSGAIQSAVGTDCRRIDVLHCAYTGGLL